MSYTFEKSKAAFARAQEVIPGGVNSPVRAFKAVGEAPVFVKHGEGAHITDIDGQTYVDMVCSWGPLILGHRHPAVVAAIQEALEHGTTFGMPTELETEMAALICELIPSVEMVRMVSSGTEATMSALRLARGYTGRDLIVKFEGCYHGPRRSSADQRWQRRHDLRCAIESWCASRCGQGNAGSQVQRSGECACPL